MDTLKADTGFCVTCNQWRVFVTGGLCESCSKIAIGPGRCKHCGIRLSVPLTDGWCNDCFENYGPVHHIGVGGRSGPLGRRHFDDESTHGQQNAIRQWEDG